MKHLRYKKNIWTYTVHYTVLKNLPKRKVFVKLCVKHLLGPLYTQRKKNQELWHAWAMQS